MAGKRSIVRLAEKSWYAVSKSNVLEVFMQSERGVVLWLCSTYKKPLVFIFSIIVFTAITQNLLAQSDSVTNESNGKEEQLTGDSHPVESVSPPVEKEPEVSLQPAASDSSEDNQTSASEQTKPVDFGAIDAPQMKTTVSPSTPKQTKVLESIATEKNKGQEDESKGGAPKARIGVQGSIWPSLSIPFGKFDGDRSISYIRGLGYNEVILIGYKILPEFLVGLQFDMLRSERGRVLDEVCEDEDSLCVSSGIGIGVQAQAQFLPNGFVNPWISYGIGISYISATNGLIAGDTGFSAPSFNFLQLSSGADFRLNRVFGLGPFVRFGAGFFFHQIESENRESDGSAIEDQALHFQLDIGVRLVFTP